MVFIVFLIWNLDMVPIAWYLCKNDFKKNDLGHTDRMNFEVLLPKCTDFSEEPVSKFIG